MLCSARLSPTHLLRDTKDWRHIAQMNCHITPKDWSHMTSKTRGWSVVFTDIKQVYKIAWLQKSSMFISVTRKCLVCVYLFVFVRITKRVFLTWGPWLHTTDIFNTNTPNPKCFGLLLRFQICYISTFLRSNALCIFVLLLCSDKCHFHCKSEARGTATVHAFPNFVVLHLWVNKREAQVKCNWSITDWIM